MDDTQILNITGEIEKTLGPENFATISDKVGELLTGNTANMQQLADKDKEIADLKSRNEKLVAANGALLQKLPMAKAPDPEDKTQKKPAKINLKDAFDKNGNFVH